MPLKPSVLSIIIASAFSQAALAELYIYPVIQAPVSTTAAETAPPAPVKVGADPTQLYRLVDLNPDQVKSAKPNIIKYPARVPEFKSPFGKQVPIRGAIENLVDSGGWSITIAPGLETVKVSWRNANSLEDAVSQIERSGVSVAIDAAAKRVSVAKTKAVAKDLLVPGASVWKLIAGKSLKENLILWGKQAGWDVQFVGVDMDYPVDHAATLVGVFTGQGGVVDRLMLATAARETPLQAEFYADNHVLVVKEAGYKPDSAIAPNTDLN